MGKENGDTPLKAQPKWRSPWLWLFVLLLLATILHIHFWYLPRERALAFSTAELPGRVLAKRTYPLWLWLPYPHQNLGVLGEGEGDLRSFAAAAAQVARISDLKFPGFGPFPVPPSKELLLAADPEEGVFVATAKVYPVLAVVARLAGKVAGNPWLSGGTVELPQGLVTVSWQGTSWTATAGDHGGQANAAGPPKGQQPWLAAGAIDNRLETIPSGVYALFREAGDLVVRNDLEGRALGSGPALPALPGELFTRTLVLLGLAQYESSAAQALVLFDSVHSGTVGGFAVLNGDPSRKLPMTGLGVAALLGEDSYSGKASGWYVLASGQSNFDTAAFLVPGLEKALESWNGASAGLSARARPAGVLKSLGEIEAALESLLPVTRDELARLQALQQLLEPVAHFAEASLVIASNPAFLELRLSSP